LVVTECEKALYTWIPLNFSLAPEFFRGVQAMGEGMESSCLLLKTTATDSLSLCGVERRESMEARLKA
jgi:hypothetical protein